MTAKKQNDQEERQVSHDPLDNILNYLRQAANEHGLKVVAAALGVVLVVVGVQTYRSRMQTESSIAWGRLAGMEAKAQVSQQQRGRQLDEIIKQCEEILEKHWETSATPWVRLKLGNARREAGRLEQALAAYRRITEEYGGSTAADMAKPAIAGTLEEMGRYEEAADRYEELASEKGDARYYLNAGRCRQLAGSFDAARQNYRKAREQAGSGASDVTELAQFGLAAAARGDKLTVPDRPADMEMPAGLQGATTGPQGTGSTQKARPETTPQPKGKTTETETRTKGKQTD